MTLSPCRTTVIALSMTASVIAVSAQQSAEAVKRQIIGSYKLMSYDNYDAAGKATPNAMQIGQITYDPAGRMTANLMTEDRRKAAEALRGQPQGGRGRGVQDPGGYVSYWGRYEIDALKGTVTHHVEGSSSVGMIGSPLVRYYEFSPDGKSLFLMTKTGDRMTGRLRWDRY